MDDLTQDEIWKIDADARGKLDDQFCVMLTHYIMGYMCGASDTDNMVDFKQAFFRNIKRHLDGKDKNGVS